MRSAGCVFNDIVDKDFDKKVKRTKRRPIAAGQISVVQSLGYVFSLCFFSFLILIQFNFLTILLGMGSMLLAFTYPFMKRITYWPQLFLGLTFNWGIIMAYTAMLNEVSIEIVLMYLAAIFWTLGYDTIYGTQDMVDDEIIGLKSTAIKFKKHLNLFVIINYLMFSILIIFLFLESFGKNIFSTLIVLFIFTLIYQIKKFNKRDPQSCLYSFRLNNLTGFLLFLSINLI
tara:strand:+ start:210 stop:896 length:687 start_codon:yes stop_codon:yes gene_type:complete